MLTVPSVSQTDEAAIDHRLGSAEIEFLYHSVIVGDDLLDTSDHFPIYADLRFKQNRYKES